VSLVRFLSGVALAAGLVAPSAALSLTLDEAITLARRNNPVLAQTHAQADAATARLKQAEAARLPTVTLSGEAGTGETDLGGFFGFGRADVDPRAAAVELRQPLFAGGAISAGVARARGGKDAAFAQLGGARALLSAQVAEAYVGVLSARELLALHEAQVAQMQEAARQADLRFTRGETARTDLRQAEARLAEARAGLARAKGDVARSRAQFIVVVGVEPDALAPLDDAPATPATLEDAVGEALLSSPSLKMAQASARAADAGVRYAQAGRLPSLSLAATASTVRDKFFPGYQADDVTVDARAARAAEDAAEAAVRAGVVGAWSDLVTARAMLAAAQEQSVAALGALDNVRHEVRVGQKPILDLLDAQREALAAQSAVVAARGGAIVAAYRLQALLRGA
jgi:outer membrane protein